MSNATDLAADVIESFRARGIHPHRDQAVGTPPADLRANRPVPRMPLIDLLRKRSSTRFFNDESITSEALRRIISTSLRDDADIWSHITQEMSFEVFVMCLNVSDLAPGAYSVDRSATKFTLVAPASALGRFEDLTIQSEFGQAAAIISVAGNIEDATQKFGGHGYRLLMTRAASLSYGMWLGSLADGLVGTVFAGFIPAAVRRALSSDISSRQQVFSLAIGHEMNGSAYPAQEDHPLALNKEGGR
jgi:hypothetical protein